MIFSIQYHKLNDFILPIFWQATEVVVPGETTVSPCSGQFSMKYMSEKSVYAKFANSFLDDSDILFLRSFMVVKYAV